MHKDNPDIAQMNISYKGGWRDKKRQTTASLSLGLTLTRK